MLALRVVFWPFFYCPVWLRRSNKTPDFRLGFIFDYDQREIIGTRQQNKTLLSKIHYIIVYFCRGYTVSLATVPTSPAGFGAVSQAGS